MSLKFINAAPLKQSNLAPWPMWLMKDCVNDISPYISTLFHISLTSSCVPPTLKEAYITPIIKKPQLERTNINNYQPISNHSVISKLLERAVCAQLAEYLDNNNLMLPNQPGYRRSHSTETAQTAVFSDIISELDRGTLVLLSMLDLSAAFYCIDHDILLNRLNTSYGIRSSSHQWMTSYLSSRTQSVRYNGSASPAEITHFGVPQVSVLGPLLFLLYTADFHRITTRHGFRSHYYVDDSQLHISCSPAEAQQYRMRECTIKCIADINVFLRSNRLRLNPTKTEFLWCATARRRHQVNLEPIHINTVDIAPSVNVRNSGVMMDGDFSMITHVKNQVRSCFHSLRQIRVIRRSLTKKAAKILVSSFICSRIDYCNAVFAGLPKYTTNHLDSVLHAAARMISGRSKYDHITSILRDELHWLPVPQRVKYKLCLTTYKAINGTAPSYISAMCVPSSTNQARLRLRSSDSCQLLLPWTKTEFGNGPSRMRDLTYGMTC